MQPNEKENGFWKRKVAAISVMLLVLQMLGASANVANADSPVRRVSATISPVTAGASTSQTYTVTISNSFSSSRDIKAATIKIPTGWSGISSITLGGDASAGYSTNYSLSNSRIEISKNSGSGDGVRPGHSFTVTFTIISSSTAGSYEFTVRAFENNSFSSGSGGEFTFIGSQPTVTVSAPTTGTLTVVKTVSNTHGGTATASNFNIHVKFGSSDVSGSPQVGSSVGTVYTLAGGSYTVSEDVSSAYISDFSSCGTSGAVTVTNGSNTTCTIVNNDKPAQLTVIKHVSGGSATAADFAMNVAGTNVSSTSFAGSETGTVVTLDAGSYGVSESGGPANYDLSTSGNCSGTVVAGDVKTCTLTNTYHAPTPTTTDLSIIKVIDNNNPAEGENVTYTITVTNNGSADDSSVVVTDNLPSGVVYISSTPSGFDNSTGTWSIGDLATGSSTSISLTVQVGLGTGGSVVVNTASVAGTLSDTNTDNNSSSVNLNVKVTNYQLDVVFAGAGTGIVSSTPASLNCTANCNANFASGTLVSLTAESNSGSTFEGWSGGICSGTGTCSVTMDAAKSVTANFSVSGGGNTDVADPAVVKTVDNNTPAPGATIIYTIVASNNGTASSTGFTVTDVLPATVNYVSNDAGATFDATTTTLTWDVGVLAPGASATLHITAVVKTDATGSITNTAILSATGGNSNTSNDSGTASATVTSSGGGSTSGGGPSSGGSGIPDVLPTPQIAGAFTSVPAVSPISTAAPVGQVLGAATELPRTGMPVEFVLFIVAAVAVLDKKFKLV